MSVNGIKREYEFSEPVSAAWDDAHVITPDGWERMKKGVQPREMEDRWIVAHEVEDNGDDAILFVRSWTGFPVAKVTVVPAGDDGMSRRVTKITWEGDDSRWRADDKESQAKNDVAMLSRSFFQVSMSSEQASD
ncbi:hypothetical protein CkaCkLH20_12440 [Colletotrichum karsti]|uniref:Uncharacterized protein n=1 Tax=Colletotrichum karsti TaxID=1095194 RepID=A0A9P6HXH3_9PEZI|nr:uncharacterized protein CkaCkLH20_12440 [Colletotrichum karsti]KAF9870081.1 hypothetical protein CkaCkLH20_12440 [Colletotrichum karsti]